MFCWPLACPPLRISSPCLLPVTVVLGDDSHNVQFTPLNHSSVVFSIFTELCNHHPSKKPAPVSCHSLFGPPSPNFQWFYQPVWICLSWTSPINGVRHSVVLVSGFFPLAVFPRFILQLSVLHSFLLPINVPLYVDTTFGLSIHLVVDIWMVSTFCLSSIFKSLCG